VLMLCEEKNYFCCARKLDVEVLVFLESCKTNTKIICLKETFPDWFLFLRKKSAGTFVIFNKKLTERDHLLNRYIFEKKENLRNYTSVIFFSFTHFTHVSNLFTQGVNEDELQ
jgi:hypothetical protein